MSGILLGILANEPYVGRKAKLRASRGTWQHRQRDFITSTKPTGGRTNLFEESSYILFIQAVQDNLESPECSWPQVFSARDINGEIRTVTIENLKEAELLLDGDHPDTFMEGICA